MSPDWLRNVTHSTKFCNLQLSPPANCRMQNILQMLLKLHKKRGMQENNVFQLVFQRVSAIFALFKSFWLYQAILIFILVFGFFGQFWHLSSFLHFSKHLSFFRQYWHFSSFLALFGNFGSFSTILALLQFWHFFKLFWLFSPILAIFQHFWLCSEILALF